jgi:hypothetical protein
LLLNQFLKEHDKVEEQDHKLQEQGVMHADEKLTAFLELESAIRICGELA